MNKIPGLGLFGKVVAGSAKFLGNQVAKSVVKQLPAKTLREEGKRGYRVEKFDFDADTGKPKITWAHNPDTPAETRRYGFNDKNGRFIEVTVEEK